MTTDALDETRAALRRQRAASRAARRRCVWLLVAIAGLAARYAYRSGALTGWFG